MLKSFQADKIFPQNNMTYIDAKHRMSAHIPWLIFFSLIYLIEYILFKQYIINEVIDLYPVAFDQTNYLKVAYTSYEKILQHGIWTGLKETATPNSILFIPQAALFFLLFGATRYNALMINFLIFLALQTSVIYLMRWLSGHYYMSAVSVGILLTLAVPFHYVGGMLDFRIDFITLCAYGLFLITIIRSDLFLHRTWSIVASIIATYMVLTRCLTSTYVFVLITMLLIHLFISWRIAPNKYLIIKKRAWNILLFGTILGSLALPFLWFHKDFLYNYYISLGAIKEVDVRKLETQTFDLWSIIKYYPYSIFTSHLGAVTMKSIGLLCFISLLFACIKWKFLRSKPLVLKHIQSLYSINVFLISSFLIPIIILTIYPSKSPSVGSIVTISIVLFFVINSTAFLVNSTSSTKPFIFLTAMFIAIGLSQWYGNTHKHRKAYKNEIKNLNLMYDEIGNYIALNKWNHITFSIDQVSDYLSGLILTDLYYERHHRLLNIESTKLGNTLFSINQTEAIQTLLNSDIYVTNTRDYPPSVYPFNHAINALRPTLKKIAEEQFIKLGIYHFNENYHYHTDHEFHVYARPDFLINGIVDNAISKNGIELIVPWQVAAHTSKIFLHGKSTMNQLNTTHLMAYIDGRPLTKEATLTIKDHHYYITVKLEKRSIKDSVVHISLQLPDIIKRCINMDNTCLSAPTSKKIILTSQAVALSSTLTGTSSH